MGDYIRKLLIVLGWVGCIVFFLYSPLWYERIFHKKSINILAWPNMFDAQFLKDFEQQSGIKVHVTYFENNEELLIKLRSGGGQGYDLIMPSDYVVPLLIEQKLLQKIDHTQLNFWSDMYDTLLDHYYDPGNQYTIPYSWNIYGIGVNTKYFDNKIPRASWRILFDENITPGHVGMLDDARELVHIAALYLFGNKDTLTTIELEQIQQLLVKQRAWVSMYTDMRSDYLLITETAPAVASLSNDIALAASEYDEIEFMLPDEGSFIVIDNLAMSIGSQKKQYVYDFLNYLYQPKILKKYIEEYYLRSPLTTVASTQVCTQWCIPEKELFNKVRFFNIPINEYELNKIWVALKS